MEAPLLPPLRAPELQRPPEHRRPRGSSWPGIPLGRFFGLEEPSDVQAEEARRLLLEARARFRSAVARAGGPAEEDRAREAWASADLQLARWALARGKGGGPLRTDDEDLFRWGLAYAREGLRLEGVTGETRERLRGVAEQLDEELSLWR